jgi:hypothetical protein
MLEMTSWLREKKSIRELEDKKYHVRKCAALFYFRSPIPALTSYADNMTSVFQE